ncbi:serine hydrolase-domain-containing protein [Aspergillus californicus]
MPSFTTHQPTFRILMLHGFAQSSERFQVKARLIVEQFTTDLLPKILPEYPGGLEYIFPDAPFRFGSDSEESSGLESRAWWLNLDDFSKYVGLENTLVRLSESLNGQPIHAAVGFSQGGALAAMITALCDASTNNVRRNMLAAQGLPVDTFLRNLPGQQPLKFVVCVSGFRGTMKYYSGFYKQTITTPSMHIIAALDTMIPEEKSLDLIAAFKNPEVIHHAGGHYIPRDRVLLRRVGDFVRSVFEDKVERPTRDTVATDLRPPVGVKSRSVSPSAKHQFMRRRVRSIVQSSRIR